MPDLDSPAGSTSSIDLVIEPATTSDLERILCIERASFSAPWTGKMLRAEIEGNPFARFVLGRRRTDRSILGYICYWIVFDEVRLINLAVAPQARRHGIGKLLVRHALAEGCVQGATRALLEVRASNAAAMALYGRFGFRHVAVRTRYYSNPTEDAILMELSLPAER